MNLNERLFTQAKGIIPGGVDSPVRAFGGVGGTPRFISAAKGAYVTDADGRDYVDLVGSWGPALLGHAHPQVVAAVQEAAARGLSLAPQPRAKPCWPKRCANACRLWSGCVLFPPAPKPP